MPMSERLIRAHPTLDQIIKLFSSLPYWEEKRESLLKEFLELLNLPIWEKRHELYQTWVLTQIDKALLDYERVIHHCGGELLLTFYGTHIGTVETEKGRVHIWSELRSPLENPIGKGRKKHIQPDYSLTFEPITSPSQTITAIECKQYRKANPKNFAEALIDYANGRPNANVLLVNYGAIPANISEKIDDNLKIRTFILGNFMPNQKKQIESFKQYIIDSLPKPAEKLSTEHLIRGFHFDLIAVDISGSMEEILDQKWVQNTLEILIMTFPNAKLLAIDIDIEKEWPKAKGALEELLKIPRKYQTHLASVLSNYDISRAIIVTDSDGWDQLRNAPSRPFLVLEMGLNESNLHYGEVSGGFFI